MSGPSTVTIPATQSPLQPTQMVTGSGTLVRRSWLRFAAAGSTLLVGIGLVVSRRKRREARWLAPRGRPWGGAAGRPGVEGHSDSALSRQRSGGGVVVGMAKPTQRSVP